MTNNYSQEKGRNKCVLYWPEKVGQYGNLSVTLRDTTPYEGFNVTSMLISDGVVSYVSILELITF